MSTKYIMDRRVSKFGTGYTVDLEGTTYYVLPNDTLGWGIYTGLNLKLVPVEGGGLAIGYGTADDAIAKLIGEPK